MLICLNINFLYRYIKIILFYQISQILLFYQISQIFYIKLHSINVFFYKIRKHD